MNQWYEHDIPFSGEPLKLWEKTKMLGRAMRGHFVTALEGSTAPLERQKQARAMGNVMLQPDVDAINETEVSIAAQTTTSNRSSDDAIRQQIAEWQRQDAGDNQS